MPEHSLIQFQWAVHEGGYRVMRAPDTTGVHRRWLVPAKPSAASPWMRRTSPLEEHPALFREFADLEPSEPSILRFANRHGALTFSRFTGRGAGREKTGARGEHLRIWRSEIRRMRTVVELLDAAASHDEKQLKLWIRVHDGRIRFETPWLRGTRSATEESSKCLDPKDPPGAARFLAQSLLSEPLTENTSANLLYHPDTRRFGVHLVPANLLGALWIQCAEAFGQAQSYRQCFECGRWMEIVPARTRSDRIYCSDRCRSKAYRRRKRGGREVRAASRSTSPRGARGASAQG